MQQSGAFDSGERATIRHFVTTGVCLIPRLVALETEPVDPRL
jgi:hypothetical protein